MGRTILASETEHEIPDDDDEDEKCYQSKEMFKGDMEKLLQINPIAHDLVEKLLACKSNEKYTARQVSTHFYFWEDGKYLDYMERASDAIFGVDGKAADKKMKHKLIRCEHNVFSGSWISEVDDKWQNKMKETGSYDDTKITYLLRLIRHTSHQLADQNIWSRIGETRIGFEKYILKQFPKLFPNVYYAVVESGNTSFNDFTE
ncbi:serine/threonine-protein kinase/endoribonuclease IRE1a-like protein isoform X1 [Tanacetum coccineum]